MIEVDIEKCIGCGACAADCPAANITIRDAKAVHGKWCIVCGHCTAVCPTGAARPAQNHDLSEILEYDEPVKFQIEPERLLNFVKFRRSVRQYTDEPVSDTDIARIVEMGRYTQTGANTQLLRYIVLSPETLREITPVALEALAGLDVKSVDREKMRMPHQYLDYQHIWRNWWKVYQSKKKDLLFHAAPHALLIVSRTGNEVDGCFNAGHLELMINSLGLGACMMGFGTFAFAVSPGLRDRVGLKEDESVIFMMVFGHPQVKYLRTVARRPSRWEKI